MLGKMMTSRKSTSVNKTRTPAPSRRMRGRTLMLERCEQRQMFATNILVSDFDGRPGSDVAEIRDRSITFVDSSAKATTLAVDNWSRAIVGEVNGQNGNEVILLPSSTSGRAKVQVVSLAAMSVTSFTIDGYANARIEDLDGAGGNEIMVLAPVSGLNQRVSVLKPTSGTQATYQVKTEGQVWVQDLDGLPGKEVLFDSGANRTDRTFSVIQSIANRLDRYDIPQTGGWRMHELDGRGGFEIVVSNLATINGVPVDADVTIFNYSRNSRTTIDVGSATDLQIRDVDADGDFDLLVLDLGPVAGMSDHTLKVIEPTTGNVANFNAGRMRQFAFAELDGTRGDEALLTNLSAINGVPQPATAIAIDFNSLTSRSYNLGRPTDLALQDLDEDGALELIATDLNWISAASLDRTLTVVTPSRNQLRSFNVGRAKHMQYAELDGRRGNELVFTSITIINAIPVESKVTVYTQATSDVITYDAGRATTLAIRDLDGQRGQELLFTSIFGPSFSTTSRSATVISHSQRSARTYDIGAVDSYSIRELDGQSGEEVVFVGSNIVSVLIQREARADIYTMPRLQSVSYMPIDSIPGDELVVSTSSGRFVIFVGLRRVVRL